MISITKISENPIVFQGDGALLKKLIDNINRELKFVESTPFEFTSFTGKVVAEKFRYIYPTKILTENIEIKEMLREFAKDYVPKFLHELRKILDCEKYEFTIKNTGKYCLRVRVFEDKEGYSLQPHLDSKDTIFSFILHLNSENPKTTVYNLEKIHTIKRLESPIEGEEIDYICQEIKNIEANSNLEMSEKQFSEGIGMWSHHKFYNYKSIDKKTYIFQYHENELNVTEGQIYALNNARYGLFKCEKIKEKNNEIFHGVRPSKIKSRRMLIMDLLAGESNGAHLMLDGIGKDPNTYYIVYNEANEIFNKILS